MSGLFPNEKREGNFIRTISNSTIGNMNQDGNLKNKAFKKEDCDVNIKEEIEVNEELLQSQDVKEMLKEEIENNAEQIKIDYVGILLKEEIEIFIPHTLHFTLYIQSFWANHKVTFSLMLWAITSPKRRFSFVQSLVRYQDVKYHLLINLTLI